MMSESVLLIYSSRKPSKLAVEGPLELPTVVHAREFRADACVFLWRMFVASRWVDFLWFLVV